MQPRGKPSSTDDTRSAAGRSRGAVAAQRSPCRLRQRLSTQWLVQRRRSAGPVLTLLQMSARQGSVVTLGQPPTTQRQHGRLSCAGSWLHTWLCSSSHGDSSCIGPKAPIDTGAPNIAIKGAWAFALLPACLPLLRSPHFFRHCYPARCRGQLVSCLRAFANFGPRCFSLAGQAAVCEGRVEHGVLPRENAM